MTTLPITVSATDLRTGVRLEYAEHGEGRGAPVVLLHGVSDSWRSFEPVLAHLPTWIRAFALSQRGHGGSGSATPHRTEDLAAGVLAFLDAMELPSAVLVGHSMGTIVAERVALDHPERVDGLVLLDAATTFRPLLADVTPEVLALRDPLDRDFLHEFQASTVAGPRGAAFVDTAVDESAKMAAADLRAVWEQCVMDDLFGSLGGIEAPAVLVWGDRDDMVPRDHQEALLGAIRDARLVVREGAGHAVHWDLPEAVAADVAEAVARCTSATVWRAEGAGMSSA